MPGMAAGSLLSIWMRIEWNKKSENKCNFTPWNVKLFLKAEDTLKVVQSLISILQWEEKGFWCSTDFPGFPSYKEQLDVFIKHQIWK